MAARSYGRELAALAGYGAKVSALLLTYLLFFLIYRLIPDAPVGTRVALQAALWAGVAWEAAKYLFVIHLGRMNLQAFYGPLAFAVSLVLWAYVSSLVLVFGALMAPLGRGPRPPKPSQATGSWALARPRATAPAGRAAAGGRG